MNHLKDQQTRGYANVGQSIGAVAGVGSVPQPSTPIETAMNRLYGVRSDVDRAIETLAETITGLEVRLSKCLTPTGPHEVGTGKDQRDDPVTAAQSTLACNIDCEANGYSNCHRRIEMLIDRVREIANRVEVPH